MKKNGLSGQQLAFVLLEAARLRCTSLMGHSDRRTHLSAIHREIGMAGYVASEPFATDERRSYVAIAAARLADDPRSTKGRINVGLNAAFPPDALGESNAAMAPPEMGHALARMFSETIGASDALATELAVHDLEDGDRDRLQLVHAHVMAACELLDERLTVLELQGAGAPTY